MKEIAHRGYSLFCTDNSREAILQAMLNQFDMIEVDIQSSKDGIIVLYHDIYINYERVKSLTYEEIKEKCPTIMTLEELLNIQSNIPYYLDIKDGSINSSAQFLRGPFNQEPIGIANPDFGLSIISLGTYFLSISLSAHLLL